MKGTLETGGVMGQCVQMWTRNYGALDQTARVCFGVLCANRKKEEVKRDFGPANKKERGACSRAHWSTEWRSVVLFDESRFFLGGSDGRVLVRTRPGERLQPNCLRQRHTGPTTEVMGIFQRDNARSHTAVVTQRAQQSVDLLHLPARPPDLSPIECILDIIGRLLQHHPQSALTIPV
ncbi:uncharacterized protein TNCV_4769841 [Trichonephila clavipes]|nr:uncharacterized protein TNCV_4769841 [Trichonephila clavipes]